MSASIRPLAVYGWILSGTEDKTAFAKANGIPESAIGYSDFIVNGRWNEVDGVLREVYQEASEALGREFAYPED